MLQGSQNQLKEVWEEADGLDPEDFDPKTFFNLHGKTNTYRQLSLYLVIICHVTEMYIRESVFAHNLFILHNTDTNGDGFFDEQELEALFTKEVKPWNLKILNILVNDLKLTDCCFL